MDSLNFRPLVEGYAVLLPKTVRASAHVTAPWLGGNAKPRRFSRQDAKRARKIEGGCGVFFRFSLARLASWREPVFQAPEEGISSRFTLIFTIVDQSDFTPVMRSPATVWASP
ncbi:MAG: hypothetical protein V5A42_00135 [Halofilum sp. (in: g-proteobacteria)]